MDDQVSQTRKLALILPIYQFEPNHTRPQLWPACVSLKTKHSSTKSKNEKALHILEFEENQLLSFTQEISLPLKIA